MVFYIAAKQKVAVLMNKNPTFALLLSFLAGCSSLHDVGVGYYLPKGAAAITITQTATCTEKNQPILVSKAEFIPTYAKDETKRTYVNLSKLDGTFTKGDATFQFYPDGRLKTFNSKQTGSGESAIKSLITILPIATGMLVASTSPDESCKKLRELLSMEKQTVSVELRGTTAFDEISTVDATTAGKRFPIQIRQDSLPRKLFDELRPIFGTVSAYYTVPKALPTPLNANREENGAQLELIEPASVQLTVVISHTDGRRKEYTGRVLVPQLGTQYSLPIQAAPLFGENEFEVTFAESGRIDKLRYAGGGGGTGALGVLSQYPAPEQEETAEEKAKKIKAQSDLIFEQQRLVACLASPKDCPK